MSTRRFLFNRLTNTTFTTWVFAAALLILLVQYAVALALYFQNAGAALSFPYPLEYQEGPVLDRVFHLINNQPIYRTDLTSPPFSVSYAPPLFWLVQAPLAASLGPAYWYGRVLSILCAFLTAVLISLALFTLTRDRLAALLSGLTFMAFPYVLHWTALDQADALALALSWGGLLTVLHRPDSRRALLLAAVLFTLAIYTRQTYFVAAPLGALGWLLQQRKTRAALLLTGMVAGFSLAAFLILNALTRGGFSYTMFAITPGLFSWKTVTAAYMRFFPGVNYLLFGALMFLIVERTGNYTHSWPLLLPYFTGALISSLFSGWAGSTQTSFFELAAALSLAAGAMYNWVKPIVWVKILFILLLAMQVGELANWSRAEAIPLVADKVAVRADLDALYQKVQAADGPVLADEYAGMLPMLRRPLPFQPVEFGWLTTQGRWQPQPIVELIQKKAYPLILLYIPTDNAALMSERWSIDIRNAVYANYRVLDNLASVYIYVPKP